MAHRVDVLVIGDELEGLLTALATAHAGARVAVVRQATPGSWLGGLSTRGGLAYMDLTWDTMSDRFAQFIATCGVKRVALCPHTAHQALQTALAQAHITVTHAPSYGVTANTGAPAHRRFGVMDDAGQTWQAPVLLDATPDADVARHLGEPWRNGLNGWLNAVAPGAAQTGTVPQHLGVSPVFTITGVTPTDLMTFEAECRRQLADEALLAQALPWHTPQELTELIDRPCYAPPHLDYVDILNPIIGIAFHRWWQGSVASYPHAEVWIDGGNVAVLPNGTLSFNGMVTHAPDLGTLLQWSGQPVIPAFLQRAMQAFEQFLQQQGGLRQAQVHAPQQLYVRQSVHIDTLATATAADLLAGGAPHATTGPYSYWLDTRGINLRAWQPQFMHFGKPQFNTSLGYAMCQRNPWLAVLGRAGGYGPLAQGTCRIVQHNALLGEALAPVLAKAACNGLTLKEAAHWPPPQAAVAMTNPLQQLPHLPTPALQLLQHELTHCQPQSVGI
jgi:hypothetical protein